MQRAISNQQPKVAIGAVGSHEQHVWKIEVPVEVQLKGARPGHTLERHPAATFLGGVDDAVSFKSYRPEWIDALPMPHLRVERVAGAMRRFNGRRVEPLWVYDHARFPFEDSSWPWGLVGRIFNSDGSSGTGALIGNRLVITAGHMVPWNSSNWWMRFVPAYFNGTSLYGAGVERIH